MNNAVAIGLLAPLAVGPGEVLTPTPIAAQSTRSC